MSGTAPEPSRRESIQEAVRQLAAGGYIASGRDRKPTTSDLTIDEALVLHSVGWEPVDLVSGVGTYSIPQGAWQWAVGEIEAASYAHGQARGGGGPAARAGVQRGTGATEWSGSGSTPESSATT